MIEEKYQIVADFAVSAVEGIKRTGMKVLALRDRYAKIMMPFEGNINHVGTWQLRKFRPGQSLTGY